LTFRLAVPNRTKQLGTRAVKLPTKTSFTANANQSNKSISPARVEGTEIVRVTGEKKNDF